MNEERTRVQEGRDLPVPPWHKWGPYVSERSWGSVREDYSADGDAWRSFPFDMAHQRAYRWGEDGIAGFCDRYQVLVFTPAFWNGKDPLLKERLFGLGSWEGNHGEDVKECYYYLDATPSHSYMKYLYKYPHAAFPYEQLKEENWKRGAESPEYELMDTGVFAESRYFDIVIEYAKATPEDLVIKIEAFNRSETSAPLHIIAQLFFRNQWGWSEIRGSMPNIEPSGESTLLADDTTMQEIKNLSFKYKLGKRYLFGPPGAKLLFTHNETGSKDAFHREIVHKEAATHPDKKGTKACLHYTFDSVPGKGSVVVHLRLTDQQLKDPLHDVEEVIRLRKSEADAFYAAIHPPKASDEEKMIQRQALAGLVWNKQIYLFDVHQWLLGDNPLKPPPPGRDKIRNVHWHHLNSMRVLLMPDKWEFPWFAAWDLAFHSLSYALIDPEFAKEQLWLLLFDQFQHPNGQIPSYEWEFSDLNPPVQAWAVLHLYHMEKIKDRDFLERCFHKLLINFAWWVNKVDSSGHNVFEGGFLGMDNISIIDRSSPFKEGVKLQQSDGTGWMAVFCLSMMRIALELSKQDRVYESLATKFFEHYVYIAHAMKTRGAKDYEMWSERDGFFYDVLTYPDGHFAKFRVRSLVGVIPMYATDLILEKELDLYPEFKRNYLWFLKNRKDLTDPCITPFNKEGEKGYLLALMNPKQLQSVFSYLFSPEEFCSSFGLRSLSKFHKNCPFVFEGKQIGYEPAESTEKIMGGNSNWRGPIWIPTNFMLIDALCKMDQSGIKGPDGCLRDKAEQFVDGVLSLFKKNAQGYRPFVGEKFPFKHDPHFADLIQFNEYFNPETGQGLGASHQTGWSSLIANLISDFRK
jgi:hypothetical protein